MLFNQITDYNVYKDWLKEAAQWHGCAIHAYVLMTNHVHLLVTPTHQDSLPKTFQSLGRRYVQYFNATHDRTGTLWEGRYRATLIESEAYLLTCCRYIELNPVRAEMVRHPRDYRWSSYHYHAEGKSDPLLTGRHGGGTATGLPGPLPPPPERRNPRHHPRGHQ
jgi:putative transposase